MLSTRLNIAINYVHSISYWINPLHFLNIQGIYGDQPDLQIRGVWLWRGMDI